jgi:catechol 2,3-dioxygenase-like lactoylglutathione lyase family enzyme
MRGISHVAIGVSDMERSLHFYRDLLGLAVTLDKEEPVRASERLFADPVQTRRRAVYLK